MFSGGVSLNSKLVSKLSKLDLSENTIFELPDEVWGVAGPAVCERLNDKYG